MRELEEVPFSSQYPLISLRFTIHNGYVQLRTNQLVSFEDMLLSFNKKSLTDKLQQQEFDRQQKNLKLLTTWLQLLCTASTSADAPTLSCSKREEIKRALDRIIDMLREEVNREKVLS